MSALTVAAIVIGTAAVSITAYDIFTRRQAPQVQQTQSDTSTAASAPAVVVPYGLPYNVWGPDYPIWRRRYHNRDYDNDTTQVINNNNNNTVTVVPPTTQTQAPTPTPQVPQTPQVPVTTQAPQVTQTSDGGLSQLHPRIGAVITNAPTIHRAKPHMIVHHPKLFQKEQTNYTTGVNDHALF